MEESVEIGMSLTTREKVRKLQRALHAKAKGSHSYRFYALYDKIYRADILREAYRRCRSNGGAAGVDGVWFDEIAKYGAEKWLDELAQELRERRYRPQAVRREYIAKPNGKQRPLGIPTVRDRVAQTAAVLVLGPIFEADLQPEQYAYRPKRRAQDAVRHVHKLLNTGHRKVIDADLSGYFDSIPHHELLKCVARRVSDGAMLKLIKMWLQMPVEEEDRKGRKHRRTDNKDGGRGTPQGAPISPLLANVYMRRFVLGWKVLGNEKRYEARIVNYADDFVICCRGNAEHAMAAMRRMMTKLRLTVNEEKTRQCRIPEDSFDFLGYTIGRCYSTKTGKSYIGTRPSRQKIQRICREISEMTSRRWLFKDVRELVDEINRITIGWSNYFYLGPVSKAYRAVDNHTRYRLRQWLRKKHKVAGKGTSRFPDEYLHGKLKLERLELRTRNFLWAKA